MGWVCEYSPAVVIVIQTWNPCDILNISQWQALLSCHSLYWLQNNFEDRKSCGHYTIMLVLICYYSKCCVCVLDICQILLLVVWWPVGRCFKERQICYSSGCSCRDSTDREHHRRLFQDNSIFRLINTLIKVFFTFISTACHRKIEMEKI